MTPQRVKEEIQALTNSYPVLDQDKLERRTARIERMRRFYEEKQEDAPPKQALMFGGFVSALSYAASIIMMHRKLTFRLKELAERLEDDIVESEKTLTE